MPLGDGDEEKVAQCVIQSIFGEDLWVKTCGTDEHPRAQTDHPNKSSKDSIGATRNMSNPFCQDGRDETPAPDDPTEAACVAIAHVLHEWLQEDLIDAQEFISAVGQLPVSLAVLFPPDLFDAEPFGDDDPPFDRL